MNCPKKISTDDLSYIIKKPFFSILSKIISLSINIVLFLGVPIFVSFKAYEYFEYNDYWMNYWMIFTLPLLMIIFGVLVSTSWFLIHLIDYHLFTDPYDLSWRYIYVQLIKLFPNGKLHNLIDSVRKYNNEVDKFNAVEELIEAGHFFDTYKRNKAIEYLEADREDLIRSLKTESIFRNRRKSLSGKSSNKYDNSHSSSVNYQGNQKAKIILDEMFEEAQVREKVREFDQESNKRMF